MKFSDCMKVADTSIGRGLVATRAVRSGEVIMRVPNAEIISSPTLEGLTEKLISHDGWYKSTLPKDLSHLPVFWPPEKIQELPRFAQEAVVQRAASFIKLAEASGADPGEWCYARSIVGSRNFGSSLHNVKLYNLVPEADLMNHSEVANVKWHFDDHGFTMQTVEDVAPGMQFFDSYGTKDALSSLLFYGFVSANHLGFYHIKNNGAVLTSTTNHVPAQWKPVTMPLGTGETRKINLLCRAKVKEAWKKVKRARRRRQRAAVVWDTRSK